MRGSPLALVNRVVSSRSINGSCIWSTEPSGFLPSMAFSILGGSDSFSVSRSLAGVESTRS